MSSIIEPLSAKNTGVWWLFWEESAAMGMNRCRACELTFSNLQSFDAHRTGSYGEAIYQPSSTGKSRQVIGHTRHSRRCLTEAQIQALGMTQDAKGWWELPKRGAPATKGEELEEATL